MKFKSKIILILIVAFVVSLFIFKIKTISYYVIKTKIDKIDKDTLSKYYNLFLITNKRNEYSEKEFLNFLTNKNQKLKEQLIKNEIKLNSKYESELKNVFQGFYHIGPDGIDNNAENVIINSKTLYGDILLQTNNFLDIKINNIYCLNQNKILEKIQFNANAILANSIICKGKVKIDVSKSENNSAIIKFINKDLVEDGIIDQPTLNVLIKDSLLQSLVEKYNYVYLPFTYWPIENFYCDPD